LEVASQNMWKATGQKRKAAFGRTLSANVNETLTRQ
jgi:hypothetical protein